MIGTKNDVIRYVLTATPEKKFEVKEYKEKRSLNANNYAWKLIVDIANKLNLSKEDVYKQMLFDYGQSTMISVISSVNIADFCKYFKEAGKSMLNGKEFTHYKIYKGSSEFDTKEMSILIDGIIKECQQLDIETKSREEINSLLESWNEKEIK